MRFILMPFCKALVIKSLNFNRLYAAINLYFNSFYIMVICEVVRSTHILLRIKSLNRSWNPYKIKNCLSYETMQREGYA